MDKLERDLLIDAVRDALRAKFSEAGQAFSMEDLKQEIRRTRSKNWAVLDEDEADMAIVMTLVAGYARLSLLKGVLRIERLSDPLLH